MALLGQASGGWTESSSALRILNIGVRNTIGVLTDDAFTQSNPTAVATNVSSRVNTTKTGVLSGSVAFARPDGGQSNFVGGPGDNATQGAFSTSDKMGYRPVGVFINSANGNPFENQPGVASGVGPYVSGMGTYGDALYETKFIGDAVGGDPAAGATIDYLPGVQLIASRNGFLMPKQVLSAGGAAVSADDITCTAESFVANADNSSTIIGVLKMPPDATQTELVYDQRI